MTRGYSESYPVYAWQIDTYYDNRKGGWEDATFTDYEYLYEFMTGKITKKDVHADKFKRLFDKGYIVSKGDSEYVNIIVTSLSETEFLKMLPAIPDELKAVSEELDTKIFELNKSSYPPHMQNLCRARSTDCISEYHIRTRVLEQLLSGGRLKPLTGTQKHSVNTILFCDRIPE